VDFDVHHGDGVQALHYDDPGVLTISFHESGRSLFPGTGFVAEMGEGIAAGTSINVPLEPLTGPGPWLAAVRAVVPPLAAAFGPDIVVGQHGADGHVWDPLAHLSLTTTAMGEAARLLDRVAHRYAGGRWLALGGGGYAVYRVVPRVWALTWLAGAHREAPRTIPEAWRARWAGDAARWDEAPLPESFDDEAALPASRSINPDAGERARETVSLVRAVMVPALLSVAEERGWWHFDGPGRASATGAAPAAEAPPADAAPADAPRPTVLANLTAAVLERLTVSPRVMAPADARVATALLRSALSDGGVAAAAIVGEWLVGVALAVPSPLDGVDRLVALGVASEWRQQGLAAAMLLALVDEEGHRGRVLVALNTVGERDPIDPLPRAVRRGVAERLVRTAGMVVLETPPRIAAVDGDALVAATRPPDAAADLTARIVEWLVRM
jgi:GNAT superfamily N-acetyltransferase